MDLAFLEETKFCLPARRSCRNPSPAFPSPCPMLPALFGTWWRNPSPLSVGRVCAFSFAAPRGGLALCNINAVTLSLQTIAVYCIRG